MIADHIILVATMNRTDILNGLIRSRGYQSYLEIGVGGCDNLNAISLEPSRKVGVDPRGGVGVLPLTSDAFFTISPLKFDLIFIDGLHLEYQVYRDILHSLAVMNNGGTIVCHDINPMAREEQIVPKRQSRWTGDGWKAWVRLRSQRRDLNMSVVDTDYGCGIIQYGVQDLIEIPDSLDWDSLVGNRTAWLNLISPSVFQQRYLEQLT